jgi:ubiquinone/menaquinone biosynthesis C-methylase UbiE
MNLNNSKKWDETAEEYNNTITKLTSYFGEKAIEYSKIDLNTKEKLNILDVAAGPGTLSQSILKKFMKKKNEKNCYLLSTDFSEKMVNIGKNSINHECIEFKVMDGENLEISNESFDFCFSMFGLMMFPNRKKGFEEVFRILKENGKVIISTWSDNPIQIIMKELMKEFGMEVGDQKKPFLIDLKDEIEKAGFGEVQIYEDTFEFITEDFDGFIKSLMSNPYTRDFHDKLNEKQKESFLPIFKDIIQKDFVIDEKIKMIYKANIGVGKK